MEQRAERGSRQESIIYHYSLLTTEIKRPLNCDKSRIERHQSYLESLLRIEIL